jgi:hypothetical protein
VAQSLPTPKINELFLVVTNVALGAPELGDRDASADVDQFSFPLACLSDPAQGFESQVWV